MREEKKTKQETESGMENNANSWPSNPPLGAHVSLLIVEVKGLITIP
jgi:hypothetical protein